MVRLTRGKKDDLLGFETVISDFQLHVVAQRLLCLHSAGCCCTMLVAFAQCLLLLKNEL